MKPPKSILDPEFRYVPAARTNVALTFARARKRMKEEKEKEKVAKIHLVAKPGGG